MTHLKRILLLLSTMMMVAPAAMGQSTVVADPVLTKPPELKDKMHPYWWRRYTIKGAEFSVKLPTVPAMATTTVFHPRLQKQRVERHLRTSFQDVVYTIDVFENPKPGQSLAEFIAEQNAKLAFDLATERDVDVAVFPGKEYSFRNKTTPGTARLVATERHLYLFAATGADAEHPAVKAFFFSIHVGSEDRRGIAVDDGPGMPIESDEGRIYTRKEVDVAAQLLNKPEPAFTSTARANKTEGRVVLRVVFHASGKVVNIQVVEGLPDGLTDASIEAAKTITFRPAQKDGKPVSVWMQLEYDFHF